MQRNLNIGDPRHNLRSPMMASAQSPRRKRSMSSDTNDQPSKLARPDQSINGGYHGSASNPHESIRRPSIRSYEEVQPHSLSFQSSHGEIPHVHALAIERGDGQGHAFEESYTPYSFRDNQTSFAGHINSSYDRFPSARYANENARIPGHFGGAIEAQPHQSLYGARQQLFSPRFGVEDQQREDRLQMAYSPSMTRRNESYDFTSGRDAGYGYGRYEQVASQSMNPQHVYQASEQPLSHFARNRPVPFGNQTGEPSSFGPYPERHPDAHGAIRPPGPSSGHRVQSPQEPKANYAQNPPGHHMRTGSKVNGEQVQESGLTMELKEASLKEKQSFNFEMAKKYLAKCDSSKEQLMELAGICKPLRDYLADEKASAAASTSNGILEVPPARPGDKVNRFEAPVMNYLQRLPEYKSLSDDNKPEVMGIMKKVVDLVNYIHTTDERRKQEREEQEEEGGQQRDDQHDVVEQSRRGRSQKSTALCSECNVVFPDTDTLNKHQQGMFSKKCKGRKLAPPPSTRQDDGAVKEE